MKSDIGYSKKQACLDEGWEITTVDDKEVVWAYGMSFPLTDPLSIHLKAYRVHDSAETRHQAMYAAFKILWPKQILTYNYWTERIFREHCNFDTQIFTIAGGASTGKALEENTLIKTPTGWIPIKDLRVGDFIASTTGELQTVLGVYPQGIRPCYRLTFSDGTFIISDSDHLWTVYSKKQRATST